MSRSAPLLVSILIALPGSAGSASAQDPAAFFGDNCAPCHTIGGGDQGGPDLKWVTQRHERQWLIRFVLDPEAMVASGDTRAVDMVKHWDGAVMPATPDLTPQLAEAILRFIDEKSNGAAAPAQGGAATPVFTGADIARGRALFIGSAPMTNGGPPCVVCHAAGNEGGLAGGGRLGADLTQVSVRLRGPRGVATWLESPPTPMMRALIRRTPLTPDENRALTAFLEDLRTRPVPPSRLTRLAGAGFGGALLGLAAIGLIWQRRFRGARRPLVEHSTAFLRRGADS
jgi:mono/diheme cytochrome c family protein